MERGVTVTFDPQGPGRQELSGRRKQRVEDQRLRDEPAGR